MERTLLVFGLHACAATLKRAAHEVLELWIRRDAGAELQAMADQASALGVVVQRVPAPTLDRLSEGGVHQGIVLRRRTPASLDSHWPRSRAPSARPPRGIFAVDGSPTLSCAAAASEV